MPKTTQSVAGKAGLSASKMEELIPLIIDCIAETGTEGLSFESVGKRAQMHRSHIAYYFPSRQAMIESAIRWVVQKGQQITAQKVEVAHTPSEALRAIVEGAFDWLEKYPRYGTIMVLFYYLASYDPYYRTLHSKMRSIGEERILSVLRIVSGKGKKNTRSLRNQAACIQGLITGNLLGWLTTENEVPLKSLKEKTVVSALLLSAVE